MPRSPAPVTVTETREVQMTDEGRISVPDWAAAVRSNSSYFDDFTDAKLVGLARASCKALEAPGVTFAQILKVLTDEGISKHDAGIFLIGAEASYCLDAATNH